MAQNNSIRSTSIFALNSRVYYLKYTLLSVIFTLTLYITLNQLSVKISNLIVKSYYPLHVHYTCNLITYARLFGEVKKIRTRVQDLGCKLLSL